MATGGHNLVLEIEPRARMTAPATDAEIAEAEQAVGAPFPADLRSLLRQTNGVVDDMFGPLLPLALPPQAVFTDQAGTARDAPAYSVIDYTLLQRSADFARLNGWDEETRTLLGTFIVLGMDPGGNMFGFFADQAREDAERVRIRSVEHDTVEIGDDIYGLERYLRFYFEECALFEKSASLMRGPSRPTVSVETCDDQPSASAQQRLHLTPLVSQVSVTVRSVHSTPCVSGGGEPKAA